MAAGFNAIRNLFIQIDLADKITQPLAAINREVDLSKEKLQQVRNAALIVGGAMVAVGGSGLLLFRSSTKAAADFADVSSSFQKIAGENSDELLRQMKRAAGGTIDSLNLITNANQAMLLGIEKNNLPEMLEISRKAAKALGKDASFMFESLAIGIGRQSRLWLDNLGIIMDADAAYEKYAKTLGKTAGQLTEVEKKTAFQIEALRLAKEKFGDIEVSTSDVNVQLQKLSASWFELKLALGQGVLPLIGPIASGLRGLVDLFNILPEPLKKVIAIGSALTIVLTVIGGGALLLAGSMAFAIAQLGGMAGLLAGIHGALGILSSALGIATGAATALNVALGGFLFPILAAVGGFILLNAIVRHFTGRGVIGLAIDGVRALWERLKLLPDVLLLFMGPLGAVIALFRHWNEIVGRLVGGIDRVRGLLPSLPEVSLPSFSPEGLRGLASSAVSSTVSNVQRTVSIGRIEVSGVKDPEKVAEAVMRKIRNQFEAA